MALTPVQEESYAYCDPDDLWLDAVELMHPLLPDTLRFIQGIAPGSTIGLPPDEGLGLAVFTGVAFTWRDAPAAAKEGPGEGELSVDGVSGELRNYLKQVATDGNPIVCNVLVYQIKMVNDAPQWGVTGPHQKLDGFLIPRVTPKATTITASLKVRDLGKINFPRVIFSRELYPSLHG